MNKLAAEEIVNLLFLPMSDEKLLGIFEKLDIEVPALDEEYKMEGEISIIDDENSGLQFQFEEPTVYSEDGMPFLNTIAFAQEQKVSFPFGLHKKDSFETVIKKIGRNPDFCDKGWKESKQWLLGFINDKEVSMGVNFKKDFKGGINNIVVSEFIRDGLEEDPYIFPCKELEQ